MSESEDHKELRESILKFNRELRRDMSTLQGYLETLEDKVRSAELMNDIHAVQTESDRIVRKLSAMSNVIGLKDGEVYSHPVEFEPKQLVDQAYAFLSHEYPSVKLSIDLDGKLAPRVEGDKDLIFDVLHGFFNLLADHGAQEIGIRINLSQIVDDAQFVAISIQAKQSRLSGKSLEQLVSESTSTKRDKRIATPLVFDWALHLLKSRSIEPEVNHGSDHVALTFFDQWHSISSAATIVYPVAEEIQDLCVLVAEDNPLNQLVTRMMIENLDWQCHVVENGQEALEAFDPGVHHCIIMDLEMPVMNGIDSAKHIREMHGESTPIIALTADAMHQIRNDLAAAGLDDFLVKPVKRDVLEDKIRNAIRQKSRKTA